MKEQIEKILEDEFGLVEAVTFTIGNKKKTVYFSDLATRLDKAIGIDEYKLERVLKENVNDITGLEDMDSFRYFGTPMNKIIKSIIKDRPLKCEVES